MEQRLPVTAVRSRCFATVREPAGRTRDIKQRPLRLIDRSGPDGDVRPTSGQRPLEFIVNDQHVVEYGPVFDTISMPLARLTLERTRFATTDSIQRGSAVWDAGRSRIP